MKKLILLYILFLWSSSIYAQKDRKSNYYINVGVGYSYSIFYAQGGWPRNFGSINIDNITVPRTAFAFSHFGEVIWNVKGGRWSVGAGYSSHNFFPHYKNDGYTSQGTYYHIDTKEYDKNIYLQLTAHYRIMKTARHMLEVSTGVYNKLNQQQRIEYTAYFGVVPYQTSILITEDGIDANDNQGGLPFNLDYVRFLKSGSAIGLRVNCNYTQSLRQVEHIALQFFLKAKL